MTHRETAERIVREYGSAGFEATFDRDELTAAIIAALDFETYPRAEAEALLAAARCIRHWHDTGRDNEGMIVSSKHVRELWTARDAFEKALARCTTKETS